MIYMALNREQVEIILTALRLHAYALELADQNKAQDDVDAVYDLINEKLHPK